MNQWSFVIAAYGVVAMGTIGLIAWALASMRRAEAQADAAKPRR